MLEPYPRLDAMCSEWSSIPRDEVLLEDVHDLEPVPLDRVNASIAHKMSELARLNLKPSGHQQKLHDLSLIHI